MTVSPLTQLTNYAAEAATRPLEQYQNRPRFLALLLSYVNRSQELETAAWDVIFKRMVDNAQNAQLDTIGKIVRQLRGGQTDDVYRIYILARIRINRSQGHPDDVIEVLQLIDPTAFLYTEYPPASAIIEYLGPPLTGSTVLTTIARSAASAGVRISFILQTQANAFLLGDDTIGGTVDTLHGFSNEANSTGGYLASIW